MAKAKFTYIVNNKSHSKYHSHVHQRKFTTNLQNKKTWSLDKIFQTGWANSKCQDNIHQWQGETCKVCRLYSLVSKMYKKAIQSILCNSIDFFKGLKAASHHIRITSVMLMYNTVESIITESLGIFMGCLKIVHLL